MEEVNTNRCSPVEMRIKELENQLKIATIALKKIATEGTYWGESMKQYAIDAIKDIQL